MDTPKTRAPARCRGFLILLAISLVAACAGQSKPDEPPTSGPLPKGIYHVDSGEELDKELFYERLSKADYIVVGEQHDRAWHHRIQLEIYRSQLGRRKGPVALGMEMFQRPFQAALDDYVAERIDEETMLERTEWETRWGMATKSYRPLWRLAREASSPVAALNVPRDVTKKIARLGLDGLSPQERANLPETIDTSNEAQREYLKKAFGRHGAEMSDVDFEHFLEAQATWDEVMAETAVDFTDANEAVDAMVIVAGRAHARRDFGIPPRMERRLGDGADDRVLSVIPFDAGERTPFGTVSLESLRENQVADYVWID